MYVLGPPRSRVVLGNRNSSRVAKCLPTVGAVNCPNAALGSTSAASSLLMMSKLETAGLEPREAAAARPPPPRPPAPPPPPRRRRIPFYRWRCRGPCVPTNPRHGDSLHDPTTVWRHRYDRYRGRPSAE